MATVYAIDISTMELTFAFTLAIVTLIIIFISESEGAKSVILQYLDGGFWIVNAILLFIAESPPSVLTFGMSYLFLGLAFLFIISAFWSSFSMIKEKRRGQI